MGKDGAEGLLALRKRNWYTIAQDRDSSIVYGMPKAAAQLGAATDILPSNMIGGAISDFLLK
jgi:two-component system response regulator WspF